MRTVLYFSLLLLLIVGCQSTDADSKLHTTDRKAIIAGTLKKNNLQMYPDSTFIYNNGEKAFVGHWHRHKDGYLLFHGESNGNPVVKISHLKAEVYNSNYDALKNMTLEAL